MICFHFYEGFFFRKSVPDISLLSDLHPEFWKMLQVEYNINKEANACNKQQEQQKQQNMVINEGQNMSLGLQQTQRTSLIIIGK